MNQLWRTGLWLLAVLGPALLLHLWLVNVAHVALSSGNITKAYVANAALTLGILAWLLNLREKYKASLGYFFLYASFAKFILFFVAFYPAYNSDGLVAKSEFAAFFVPYALCLVVETTALIIRLNRPN